MNKMKYERPNFDFQEMKLMEKVADKCWGNGYAYVDANGDDKIDMDPINGEVFNFIESGTGCKGGPENDLLRKNLILDRFPNLTITDADVATNIKKTDLVHSGDS